MKKLILILIGFILLFFGFYGESRNFFYINNGKCITVWKSYNGVCYIIPDKYYGLWKPSKNFIKTSNLNEQLTIFFTDRLPNTLIIQSEDSFEVYNNGKFIYLDYDADSSKLNTILYKHKAKLFYKDLLPDADLIDIDIKENYAIGKNGRRY